MPNPPASRLAEGLLERVLGDLHGSWLSGILGGAFQPWPDAVPGEAPLTIAELVGSLGGEFDSNRFDFDMLNAAIAAAGLGDALADPEADLTVFAPNDRAFLRLAYDLGYDGRDEEAALGFILDALAALDPNGDPIPLLTTVLTYHVVPEGLTAAEIRATPEIETLAGAAIRPFGRTLTDLDPTLPDARLVRFGTDIEAANGLVHIVDRILLPADLAEARGTVEPAPTIAARIAELGEGVDDHPFDFDILNLALEATGLDAALDDDATELTLLAPTDGAFLRLARALGDESGTEQGAVDTILAALSELGGGDPLPVLEDVLLAHVVEGRLSREQLIAQGEVATLGGTDLSFERNWILDAEPDAGSRFIVPFADQLAGNGAFHAISGVLLPVNLDVI